jgi:hypothetical protein
MASSFFKRLEKKYGSDALTGGKYHDVIRLILAHNNEKIGNAVGRLTNDHFQKQGKGKQVNLPDLESVLPKRSVHMIKAAQSGDMIMETMRDRLQRDLREVMAAHPLETKEGRISRALIKDFQSRIKETFESSVKRDPKTGVPGNVRNIAVTETRSTINAVKEQYHKRFQQKNPDMLATKTWVHNRSLSKKPRRSHMELNGQSMPFDRPFQVERDREPGVFDMMSRPHDSKAPAEQIIGCSCDYVVSYTKGTR